MHLDEVCRQTDAHRWGGRVAIGHVTKLSAIDHSRLREIGRRLADAGVAVTVLPADLFLMGREHDHHVPRGVAPAHRLLAHGVICSLATNKVLNPFTPFGDCSLIRMANLYANTAQIGGSRGLRECFDMITTLPARLLNAAGYGVAVGHTPRTSSSSTAAIRPWQWRSSRPPCSAISAAAAASPEPQQPCISRRRNVQGMGNRGGWRPGGWPNRLKRLQKITTPGVARSLN
jgi:hypothetical protein